MIGGRLAEQNNRESWIDCNASTSAHPEGRPHHWLPTHAYYEDGRVLTLWWDCARCKVRTRTTGPGLPRMFLRKES